MKRDDLIEILKNNWDADEDICFVWSDGGFGTNVGITDNPWQIYEHTYEVLEDGEWKVWNSDTLPWMDFYYCKNHGHLKDCGKMSKACSWVRTALDKKGTDFSKALFVCKKEGK